MSILCLHRFQKPIYDQMKYMTDEMCILVTKNDKSIGKASKLECHLVEKGLPLHRAFSLFLYCNNHLLLQQRSIYKKTWPLKWTNSCCSHPLMLNNQQEPLETAILRKSMHELGIVPTKLQKNGTILYKASTMKWGEHELDHIYTGSIESFDIPYNTDEIKAIKWITSTELSQLSSEECTPWFELIRTRMDLFNIKPFKQMDFTQD